MHRDASGGIFLIKRGSLKVPGVLSRKESKNKEELATRVLHMLDISLKRERGSLAQASGYELPEDSAT